MSALCTCVNCLEDKVPFAHRPLNDIEIVLTEINAIIDFRHPNAQKIMEPIDVPEGEGHFLIQWKGVEQQDWIEGDNVFTHGLRAIRTFFTEKREKRKAEERKHLEKLTHISSLYDIQCKNDGIVADTGTDYKLKIAGLTDNFIAELNHPVWGQNITKLFEIVRENDDYYVWVSHFQVANIFENTVKTWEKKQRTRPTPEEIEKMDWFDFGRYLIRKDEGYYTEESYASSSSSSSSDDEGRASPSENDQVDAVE